MPRAAEQRAERRSTRPSRVGEANRAPGRLLLDTRVWLWWQTADRRLGPSTREAIASAVEVRFSAASAWEIAIKLSLGKLTLPRGADIEVELARDGFEPLAIDISHAAAVSRLPMHHRDPFDRMLIAQATIEDLTFVTADVALARYGVAILPATE